MKIALFYHSLVSDWNHGNAHFLRGVVTELLNRGHDVDVYEPSDGWSLANLVAEHGTSPLREFRSVYPRLRSVRYDADFPDLELRLEDRDLVIVHEWNEPKLVNRIARHRRAGGGYVLLFHDTHHRSVTEPSAMKRYELGAFDGVLAFGAVIGTIYRKRGWADHVKVWHEAADTNVFKPVPTSRRDGDLVWIGNWGDNERTREISEFLLKPARRLGLKTAVHGVRYPAEAIRSLSAAGIRYGGWLPNYRVPSVFATHRVTLHIPRRPYVEKLPGIPTIRVFEALACGIPLVSAPWEDRERLFSPGEDFLVAKDGREAERLVAEVLSDGRLAAQLSEHGRRTIRSRHTCAHRVDELLAFLGELRGTDGPSGSATHGRYAIAVKEQPSVRKGFHAEKGESRTERGMVETGGNSGSRGNGRGETAKRYKERSTK